MYYIGTVSVRFPASTFLSRQKLYGRSVSSVQCCFTDVLTETMRTIRDSPGRPPVDFSTAPEL